MVNHSKRFGSQVSLPKHVCLQNGKQIAQCGGNPHVQASHFIVRVCVLKGVVSVHSDGKHILEEFC